MYWVNVILLFLFLIGPSVLSGQTNVPWYEAESSKTKTRLSNIDGDCIYLKEGFDDELNAHIVEFEDKALFIHTLPAFKKWNRDKFLTECSAHIYKAEETLFLLMNFKINSENAKHSYGKLEKGTKIKVFFTDGEHIYMENIERDRGTIKRTKKYTIYKGIFPIDKNDKKELKKKEIERIGIIWEEGYQDYEIQNMDLIKNQLNCLESK